MTLINKPRIRLLYLLVVFSYYGLFASSPETSNVFHDLKNYINSSYCCSIKNFENRVLNENDIDLSEYIVIDLRSSDAFKATPNPINGAYSIELNNLFESINDIFNTEHNNKKILLTCYSGQTAAYAWTLLSLKGYDVYIMNFGMSCHDVGTDKWSSNCSDKNLDDLVQTMSVVIPKYNYPVLNANEENIETVLEKRIEAAITEWESGLLIGADEVIDNFSDYNIIAYISKEDYCEIGHIEGAYQVDPGTMAFDCNLNKIDPIGENVIYGYTGLRTAAEVAYLTVIGYDVKSIKFGLNNMCWSRLSKHKWCKDLNQEQTSFQNLK